MKSYHSVSEMRSQKTVRFLLLVLSLGFWAVPRTEAATNVVVWDSGVRFADPIDAENRVGWKAVPSELFAFEADPLKAASDPGYSGREYSFTGDAIVENRSVTAVFWSGKGRVVIYSKADVTSTAGVGPVRTGLGRKILEFVPGQSTIQPATIRRCEILRNAGDEVALQVSFSGNSPAGQSAIFSFGRTEIVEIKPGDKMQGISLLGPVAYGIVPGFVGDDLIFNPAEHAEKETLHILSENMFLGLLPGEDGMLVMTWPKGNQQMKLRLSKEQSAPRLINAIEFDPDGQSFYLAPLTAPGIWHREMFKASHLEADVASEWKKPFAAKWETQLSEAGVKATFAFRESKGQVWRGVPGSYSYPVWFDGDKAFFHLSKKVPPKGEALIYFLEGRDTPRSIPTPVDILKATLGRPMSEPILDPAGRKLRTHHRRGGDGVHRACTCGCTEAIQAVFEAGQEVARKAEIEEALGDMIYFVERHVERIQEYKRFADDMIKLLQAKGKSAPELKSFLDDLEQIAQQILQEQSVQKENMKSPEYTAELVRQTMALTNKKDSNNLKAYMDLSKDWRGMGGAQDYVVAQSHTLARKLCQAAGYGCVNDAKAVAVAEEVRRRCRQCLRNPDGYEIWADY